MTATFLDDLDRHGPGSVFTGSLDDANDYCARLAASHYENFHVVTWLTPRALRPAFASIYAFCRWADDLGDELGDRQRSTKLLAWWRDELRLLYEGRTRHPVMAALAPTISEYSIPIDPFLELIEAFEQDQEILDYDTHEQLLAYCARSANPVGRLVLYLARASEPANVALSDRTCTGLQLANFWQDVARDVEIGRIYIPREDRERFGVSDDQLRERRFSPTFAALLRFEVDRTRALLREGWPLAARIAGPLAVDVELFSRGGLAILDAIERQGFDVLTRRPSLSKLTKLGLLARAILQRRPSTTGRPEKSGIASI